MSRAGARALIFAVILAGCGAHHTAPHHTAHGVKLCKHHYSIITYSDAGTIIETPHVEWLPCASMGVK